MLQNIRERLTGPLAWFIVGLIVLPFALWGIQEYEGIGGDPVVAKVGPQKIRQSQFRASYQQRVQQMQALLGGNFKPELVNTPQFRESVLEDMTQDSMLRQFTRGAGYRVSDSALFEYVRQVPAFQQNGAFSTDAYHNWLLQNDYTPERFERQMRGALAIEQMRQGILGSGFITDAAFAQEYRIEHQTRAFAYAVLKAADYEKSVRVTDEDVARYYESHKSGYNAPERLKLQYLELSLDAMPKAANPGPEVLKAMYGAEQDVRFSAPEERLARHILVSFGADKAAAKKKAEALASRLKGGADFAALAKAESDDPGSRGDGGSLGWIRRGQMVKPFEETLFSLKKDQVSAPVESEFGWHIIKLDDVHPPRTRPFEDKDVQAELLELFQRREAEKHFQEDAEKLEQLTFESPTSLEPAAKALDAALQTTDWITRKSGSGIAATEAVRNAAFSEDVLSGENSRPIQLSPTRQVVVRKLDYEQARQKTLDEVKDQARADLVIERAREKAAAEAGALLAEVKGGKAFADAAKAHGAAVTDKGAITRDSKDVDKAIIETLFKLPRPSAGGARYALAPLAGGDVAVIALTAVNDADPAQADAADRRRELARLRDAEAGAEFSAYRGNIADTIKVEILQAPETDSGS